MKASLSEIDTANETLRKWSDLPRDVLTQIVRSLSPQTDLPRIRGVYPEWRSALPLPINRETGVHPLEPTSWGRADRRDLGGNWVGRISDLMGQKRRLFNPLDPFSTYFFPKPSLTASFNRLDKHHFLPLTLHSHSENFLSSAMESSTNSMKASLSEINTANETLRKWSDLPNDVLTQIVRSLSPHTDLPRIRGVCSDWRSALPLPINCETRLPPLEPTSSKVILIRSRFYFLSPLTPSVDDRRGLGGNWVARISDLMGQKRFLFNPFNLVDSYFFPKPSLSASFNLLDLRVSELALVYTLFVKSGDQHVKPISKKVVGDCQFAVLAELENGGGLVYWKNGDKKWTRMEKTASFRAMDICYHNGKFYVFELSGWRIGVIDPCIPDSVSGMEFIPGPEKMGEPIDDNHSVFFNGKMYIFGGCYLASSNGRLYLVKLGVVDADFRKVHRGNAFVFVLNEDCLVWEHVNSLGDEILFIGRDASFSIPNSSSNLPQWKSNSICMFTHPFPLIFDSSNKCGSGQKLPQGAEHLDSIHYAQYCRHFSLFDVEKQENGLIPFLKLRHKTYTGLFFPPPPWVKFQCPTLGNVEVRLDGLEFSCRRQEKFDGSHRLQQISQGIGQVQFKGLESGMGSRQQFKSIWKIKLQGTVTGFSRFRNWINKENVLQLLLIVFSSLRACIGLRDKTNYLKKSVSRVGAQDDDATKDDENDSEEKEEDEKDNEDA